MNFNLTPEQELLRKKVQEFAENELKPIAIENDENKEFPMEAYKKLGEMGILGLPFQRNMVELVEDTCHMY